MLGGDDLHVPALLTLIVRMIQMIFLVFPLGIFVWKQSLIIAEEAFDSSSSVWPVWRYLSDWWGEVETIAAKQNENYEGPPECAKSVFARYYPLLSTLHLACTLVFCLHSLCLEYHIWYWSCQGTPTMRQPRTRKVQKMLEKRLGICTFLLALIVGSTYFFANFFFARSYHKCFHAILDGDDGGYNIDDDGDDDFDDDDFSDDSHSSGIDFWVGSKFWYGLGALLALSQAAEVVVAALFYARLQSKANATVTPSDAASNHEHSRSSGPSMVSDLHTVHHELMEEMWADRCQSFFRCMSISTCFLFGGRDLIDNAKQNNSYQHLAQSLADLFETKGTLDVVPTDLFTGLFILQRIQLQRILQTRRKVLEQSPSHLSSIFDLSNSDSSSSTRISSDVPLDNQYHPITSPKRNRTKTGLRSRSVSTNDLRPRVAHSSCSPSPQSGSNNIIAPNVNSIMDIPGTTSLSAMNNNPAIPLSHTVSKPIPIPIPTPSSTLIRLPTPPSQYLQQKIFRRNIPSSTQDTDLLLPNDNNVGDGSFYRATSRQVLNPNDPRDVAILEEGAQMSKYALCIYTWLVYFYVNPITGLPRLVCPCGSESGMPSCQSCCCKICKVGQDRNNNTPQTAASMLLHRRRRPSATMRRTPSSRSIMSSSMHSREGSDGSSDEMGTDYHPVNCADFRTLGDNFCEWHKKSLLLMADIPDADLIYADFNNKLSSVPYCILLDHEQSVVVLVVRGSLSMEDIVTDTLALPVSLEGTGNQYGFDGKGQYCHAGVLACFENVLRDLQKHKWLERLLEQQYPNYQLRITGHSLGASVCTLLGYVFRSRYPTLKVFGYSPPGCTMTWKMATGCESFVTTFVVDNDWIPRLSVLALEELRDEVLEIIGRIKVPKHEVFENFWKARKNQRNRASLFGRRGGNGSNEDDGYDDNLEELTEAINKTLDEVPSDTTYKRQLRDFLRVRDERKEARGGTHNSLRMYPSGKMIHLIRTGEEKGCSHMLTKCATCCTTNAGFVYTPVYISNDDLDEIVVSSRMMTDHIIHRTSNILNTLSEKYSSEVLNIGREGVAAAYPRDPLSDRQIV